ncbi:MAG TPA: SDR family oxidoreductase [Gemmatimonadaceae bacterium]|nr:SDR family oxidoreductase [Gemmatimonadaceae bacterium]
MEREPSRSGPVLVIGATRGTGTEIVSRLLREGFAVRALARSPERARESLGPRVDIVSGDVTKRETLAPAIRGVSHIIDTAGVTRRPAPERDIIAVEYEGVRNVLAAAKDAGFGGRFLYMTAIGVTRTSIEGIAMNLIKGRTFVWRRRAEEAIRASGIDYTIIRCARLTNDPGGVRALEISQRNLRMSLRYRISRADAAEAFVQALRHPITRRTTFDLVWSRRPGPTRWDELFSGLQSDRP